jgi:hypothetical protein
MKKFELQELRRLTALESAGGAPVLRLVAGSTALQAPTSGDPLRSLVKFAMRQGYYELWNKPPGSL